MEKTTITNNVGTTLNTDGLVKAIAEASKATENPISQKDIHTVLNLLKTVVNNTLATGQKIQMTGFLSFSPSYRAPRKGNNVVTNEPMDIPGCVVVTIKAGKALKETMRNLDETLVNAIRKEKE